MLETTTERREQRMLDAMLDHGNRNARIVVTVTLSRADGRQVHQAFRFKAWDGRDGKMLTADLMDGDWAAGVKATKVLHVNLAKSETFPAKNDGRRYDDALVSYAASAAARWLTDGTLPAPANGTVEAVTSDFCSCCGKELTDDTSISLGIGPECEKRVYGRATKRSGTITGRAKSAAPAAAQATLAEDLAGRAGGFAILQNGSKVAHASDSREAMEMASSFYRRSPHLRFTVVDEANGEMVVEYDA